MSAPPPMPVSAPSPWHTGPTGYGGWLLVLSAQCLYGVVHLLLAAGKAHHLQNSLLDLLAATSDGLLLILLVARSRLAGPALYGKFAVRLLITASNLKLAWKLLHTGPQYGRFVHGLLLRQGIALGVTVAWLLYWRFSRRVRNTYSGQHPAPPPPLLV